MFLFKEKYPDSFDRFQTLSTFLKTLTLFSSIIKRQTIKRWTKRACVLFHLFLLKNIFRCLAIDQ
ncbi:hypothetical protein [Enterococcus thailandicus]|uniref:hypothetical protein n=1 Tax=Enterococcus thailandicus TaxID=417368 RepID=UPI0034DD622B